MSPFHSLNTYTESVDDALVHRIPWSPIARGCKDTLLESLYIQLIYSCIIVLARPLANLNDSSTRGAGSDSNFEKFNSTGLESSKEINRRIEQVAKETGHSMAQIAYAWSLHQPFVSAPIIGTSPASPPASHVDVMIKLTT